MHINEIKDCRLDHLLEKEALVTKGSNTWRMVNNNSNKDFGINREHDKLMKGW